MQRIYKQATVFGGTGFIGRHVVQELARLGMRIKVASRYPESAYFLRPSGHVGQIASVYCDYSEPESVTEALKGSDYAVNCTGILYESRKGDFNKVHAEIPQLIAEGCIKENVKRFVHISALGIDISSSRYANSKRDGEALIHEIFPKATIMRPSLVFGHGDDFFNKFATLSSYLPALPLIGGGKTRFQPVYVGDIADAIVNALTLDEAEGKTFELGGPEVFTFQEILEKLLHYTCRDRYLVNVPWPLARMQASILGVLPKPLLTKDQVELLRTDNVVSEYALNLGDLGIIPKDLDTVLPGYLHRYCQNRQYRPKLPAG
jgi:NADH dehydrogenase